MLSMSSKMAIIADHDTVTGFMLGGMKVTLWKMQMT